VVLKRRDVGTPADLRATQPDDDNACSARWVVSPIVWKFGWRILPVGEVHDQPAALAGGHRRSAPWGKGISKPVARHELEPLSLSELIHRQVRVAIETAVHEELRTARGAWWRHCAARDAFQRRRRERMHIKKQGSLPIEDAAVVLLFTRRRHSSWRRQPRGERANQVAEN
jgi:hypothetical protein